MKYLTGLHNVGPAITTGKEQTSQISINIFISIYLLSSLMPCLRNLIPLVTKKGKSQPVTT